MEQRPLTGKKMCERISRFLTLRTLHSGFKNFLANEAEQGAVSETVHRLCPSARRQLLGSRVGFQRQQVDHRRVTIGATHFAAGL